MIVYSCIGGWRDENLLNLILKKWESNFQETKTKYWLYNFSNSIHKHLTTILFFFFVDLKSIKQSLSTLFTIIFRVFVTAFTYYKVFYRYFLQANDFLYSFGIFSILLFFSSFFLFLLRLFVCFYTYEVNEVFLLTKEMRKILNWICVYCAVCFFFRFLFFILWKQNWKTESRKWIGI